MGLMKKKSTNQVANKDDEKLIFALDVGSSNIRLIAGEVLDDRQIYVKGMLELKSAGVVKGNISDISALARSVAQIINEFQEKFNVTIDKLVTGVSGMYIRAENQVGTATVTTGTVTVYDRNRAIKNAIAGLRDINVSEFSIIHTNPQSYKTETSNVIVNPINMFAKRLDVSVHIIGCNYMYKKNIEQAVKMTNPDLSVSSVIFTGNAAASAVVTAGEKEIGVICIDIGGGTVNVTVFEGNRQLLSFGIDDGGNYITSVIAKSFGISMDQAEKLKCQQGIASPYFLKEEAKDTEIPVPISKTEEIGIRLIDLSSVINDALVRMIDLIFAKINMFGSAIFDRQSLVIGGGIVLTGGTSKLDGIEKVFSQYITQNVNQEMGVLRCSTNKVRIGHPIGTRVYENAGDVKFLSDSDKAVCTGLLRSGRFEDLRQYSDDPIEDHGDKNNKSVLSKFKAWVREEIM